MSTDLDTQYKLFSKYWKSGLENQNIKDFQTADNLRKKSIPAILELINDDNKIGMSDIFGELASFLFDYFLCQNKQGGNNPHVQSEMRKMAEKAIELNPNSFYGHFYLVIDNSWNLKTAHAGNMPTVYKGKEAADTIVGTAINMLVKGAIFATTGVGQIMSNSNFNESVQNLIKSYKHNLQSTPVDAGYYLDITSKLFNIAEYCQEIQNSSWKELYSAIKDFDINLLDYSEIIEDRIDEAKEAVLELYVLADSKL